ncbi:MAG: alanyl-tRNA editing protein [Lachnospiraceae bacterium]|nr:alanyl-tRNA editing protein [Lachnospiraceae bacterium]
MIKTKELYYEDQYMKSFTATVLECTEKGADYIIVLDQTAFFPEQGGQSSDTGLIAGIPVSKVTISDGIIYHYCNDAVPEGFLVECTVDFDRRFSFMQCHSGEHMFSGTVHNLLGGENVGFHLSDNTATMDFNIKLTKEELRKVETIVNQKIWENAPIIYRYPTLEEAKELDFRCKIDLMEGIRIVVIPGVDACACCAPHVAHTGEIGLFKVTGTESKKDGIRVHFAAGQRALEYINSLCDCATDTASYLSVSSLNLLETVKGMKEDSQNLKFKLSGLSEALLIKDAEALFSSEPNICLFADDIDMNTARRIVNKLMPTREGYVGVFIPSSNRHNFIIGSNTKDCTKLCSLLSEKYDLKAGGSASMIQGSTAESKETILHFLP